MELIELNVKKRETQGKGAARKIRAANAIPAIVYGAKNEPVMLTVDTPDFDKIIRENGTSGLFFDLKIDDGEARSVMLKDIQMDTWGLNYVHIDFHEIDMDTKVSVTVPVETEGVSAGSKEGGMLQIIRRELDILCKPKHTPESIVLDISGLNIGDAIHVEDIDLGDDIEIPHEVNFTVITIVPPASDSEEDVEDDDDDDEEEVIEEAAPEAE
ncbi:MAG TPA: 50S ribosomal protein L25 [Desulfobacteraceae bacterium]|nr:50S ribosomal protein L25 [Desulfobacteraceae bacterium]